jgi:CheY-like chemotaxis protein
VEDSLTTRKLECLILEAHGYEVDTATDGLDALNKVQSQTYDLVLSDLDMPKLEGFELCRRIRQNPDLKNLKVVIVTALSREEDKRRGIEVGAHAYIVKSTSDQASLVDTVKRLVG